MIRRALRFGILRGFGFLLGLLLGTSGCAPGTSASLTANDLALRPPEGWTPAVEGAPEVPGDLIAAWHGPDGATLVAYRNLPIPGPDPAALATELANRLRHLPGTRILREETRTIGATRLAHVEAVGAGNGGGWIIAGLGQLVPGAIPTHRVAYGLPRATHTLWLVWYAPETTRGAIDASIEQTLANWLDAKPPES
jgi:hypothetical protein